MNDWKCHFAFVAANKAAQLRDGFGCTGFGPKGARSVALRPVDAGAYALQIQLPNALLFILLARKARQKNDRILYLRFAQGQRLHVLIEPGIPYAIAFVVMVQHIP